MIFLTFMGPGSKPCSQGLRLVELLPAVQDYGERAKLEDEIVGRPECFVGVLLGTKSRDAAVAAWSRKVVDRWASERDLAALLKDAPWDFDKLLNELVETSARTKVSNEHVVRRAQRLGRALDAYFVGRSKKDWTPPRSLMPLSSSYVFDSAYLADRAQGRQGEIGTPPLSVFCSQAGPKEFAFLQIEERQGLKEIDAGLVLKSELSPSGVGLATVIWSDVVDFGGAYRSLVICGSDVRIAKNLRGTMVIAAGDVLVNGDFDRSVVISGGHVRAMKGLSSSAVLAPRTTFVPPQAEAGALFLDGARQPARDFFFFRDLWEDYGMEASAEKAGVRITKIKADSTFSKHFKVDDLIEGRKGKTITSDGHFRRLVGHCLDLGELEFDVRRNGEAMKLAAKLPKRDWKGK